RPYSVMDIIIAKKNPFVLCSGDDSVIHIYDLDTFEEINSLKGHEQSVSGICLSDNDKYLFSISYDDSLMIWDTETGKMNHRIENIDLPSAIEYFSDGIQNLIVIGSAGDYSIRFYDLNGKLIYKNILHSDYINQITTHYASKGVYSVSDDKKIIFWDNKGSGSVIMNSYQGVTAFTVTPDNNFFIFGGDKNQVEVWDTGTFSLITRYTIYDPVTSLATSPDNKWLIIGDQFHIYAVDLNNLKNSQPILIFELNEPLKKVVFNPNKPNSFYVVSIGRGIHYFEIMSPEIANELILSKSIGTKEEYEDIPLKNVIYDEKSDDLTINHMEQIKKDILIEYEIIENSIKNIVKIIQNIPEEDLVKVQNLINNMKELKSSTQKGKELLKVDS
ncbi:MAG: hypothetical protein ACFFD1_08200, partial [Candidatus Thorarchaeota archaeon]